MYKKAIFIYNNLIISDLKQKFMLKFSLCVLFFWGLVFHGKAQTTTDEYNPSAFLSLQVTLGRHNVIFKDFAKTPAMSFGFKLNAGIYVITNRDFRGGLQYTLIEGASYHKNRRKLSEDFVLPHPEYDKHLVFKFAQFKSSNVGWFSEIDLEDNYTLFHQIGFGRFGLTEKSPLLDFAMHNHVGLVMRDKTGFRVNAGLMHDLTIGIGNPNDDISNIGVTLGSFRGF